ncbi:helix-turn-helix domain-containing protein [Streptomyces sp. TLI_146]|uniref:helix-turn-helix transcriptional regulator n=1 Tax=Streptomyces sp. TLI_146 TaxID=1938858 RepID=UPI000C7031E6|nr:helix-turn-helix domain-containing protein [Streptomyces sp. TLI_146]PKV90063.1 sugar-specific transcriptional regulator TrmB [Streptomyces sp. TLI_146]
MSHLLEPVGLSADDSTVYLDLLSRPHSVSDGIAHAVQLTPGRVRACLRRLMDAGLCHRFTGPPECYVAAPPDVALAPLLRRRAEALDRLRAQSWELAVRARAASCGPGGLIETITGQDAVLRKIAELELGARREVCVIDSPPYLQGPIRNSNELQALARGVRYRAIYHAPGLTAPGSAAVLEQYIAAGEQARSLPWAHLKMLLVDRRYALVPLSFASRDATVRLLVGSSPVLDAVLIAFESLWDRATPLGRSVTATRRAGALEARDREILRLMAAGLKDRAIARALGLGERTVIRRVQALMASLDAATRFQAGMQATRRGWLDTTSSDLIHPPGAAHE